MNESPHPQTERLLALLQKALGHELPNRLLAIQGLARLLELEEANRLGPEGKDYLQRLAAAGQQTHHLVKALADFIRLVRAADLPETIVLVDALRDAAIEVKPLSPAAVFGYDFQQADLSLRLPRSAFRQVALQLLRNAAQAGAPDRPLHIEVGARDDGAVIAFWVKDNGRGMTPESQARLFEPFIRRESGIGLGLSIVRHLVESWNGSLQVESMPTKGSTFTVMVPKS
jgi:signal transduction histidine kinase